MTIIARKQGWEKKNIEKRVSELCELMGLPNEKDFIIKKPREISGGQQQRVGIARALFMNPKIMLMDEPFSALDPITRQEIQDEFVNLQKKLQLTIVLVTHDLSEAFRMADEIVLLNKGKIEQKSKPSGFLLSPSSPFVEDFIRSHSPGNLLKEIFLYSVINTNLYSSEKLESKIQLTHVDSGAHKEFPDPETAATYLKEQGQSAHYWVKDKVFQQTQSFAGEESSDCLRSTHHILEGMSQLLNSKSTALPVVNDQNELVGVFSSEALDAL